MSLLQHNDLEPVEYNCSTAVKDIFTRGHCAYLAEKLHQKLEGSGWLLGLMVSEELGSYEVFTHAVVVSPCGEFFLDINGLQRVEDHLPGWIGDYIYYPSCYEEFFFHTADWDYFSTVGLDRPNSQYVTTRARLLLKAVGLYER